MKGFNLGLKGWAAGAALGVFAVIGTANVTSAQNSRREDRQEQKIERQKEKIERQRAKLARERQEDWRRRNGQIIVNRRSGSGYYTLNPAGPITSGRYRVVRDGRFYNTDNRGAELLRNAVNEGYRQGFTAARLDFNGNRRMGWSNSSVYRSGTVGYQNSVDRGQYQYYFRQGFQRGYQDGSNSEYQNGYSGDFRYGSYNNGSPTILGTILNEILNIQSY